MNEIPMESLVPSRRLAKRLLLVALIAVVGLVAYDNSPRGTERHRETFIDEWSSRFSSARTLEAIKPLQAYTRTLPSGEWVAAICAHSCCSGSGYDATVIYDSRGATRVDRSYTFCGIETMYSEMDKVEAQSADEFYRGLEERFNMRFEIQSGIDSPTI